MYSQVPSPPSHSPTSPSTPSTRLPTRLRGLSYLLSREGRPSTLSRSTSYPTPTSPSSPGAPTRFHVYDLSPRSSNPDNIAGWNPASVGGESATSRVASQTLSITTTDSSNNLTTESQPSTMGRTRSATVGDATSTPTISETPAQRENEERRGMAHQLPSIRFTAHQAPGAQRPSLVFSAMARILPTGREVIKVGRYSERDNHPPQAANVPSSAPVGFKSKVVSRRHCEFWYTSGRWYIKDVKSSSGTFLNHIRLSAPGTESRPFPVNDGDIVQLGIDFKGGEEMIFRCVKIRVELNKGWQNGPSSFNVQSHKRLQALNNIGTPVVGGSSQDCSICLGGIAPCQSLFVAPCSHTWHYKCIRVLVNGPMYPHFVCPNCRAVADLDAELDDGLANNEQWEEIPPEVANGKDDAPTPGPLAATSRPERIEDSEVTAAASRQENSRLDHSDIEIPETSDSDARPTAQNGRFRQSRDTPSPSSDEQPEQPSNSTVPAVDIAPRRSISEATGGLTPHLQRQVSRDDRGNVRTPSPNGLPSSLTDGIIGPEGPMTPRNDIGPFVFDGSDGRTVPVFANPVATPTLDETADMPTPTRA